MGVKHCGNVAFEKSSRRFDLEEMEELSMHFRSDGRWPIVDSVERNSGLFK